MQEENAGVRALRELDPPPPAEADDGPLDAAESVGALPPPARYQPELGVTLMGPTDIDLPTHQVHSVPD